MTILTTDRLKLMALPAQHLRLAIDHGFPHLYTTLGLAGETLDIYAEFLAELGEAIRDFCLPNVEAHPGHYEWYTHWLIILPEEKRTIGGIGLGGTPKGQGSTEVGYFVDARYNGRGFATEALGALISWAAKNPELLRMIAHTPAGHLASQRILQKNGFKEQGQEEGVIRWVLETGQ